MSSTPTRRYHRVTEDKRIQTIALREQGNTLKEISRKTKVKLKIVHAVLHKWNLHHNIQDLSRKGRLAEVDDRTRRRLARMTQSGEVSTAPGLALLAASHDVTHISASTARRMLHHEGLHAMHMIKKPLLTREHKRKRLEFARTHRDWT
ncbi:hypothetical protein EON65_55480, partial [archaeon]